jgi:chromosome segregation ATPase
MREMEARMDARVEAQAQTLAETQRIAHEALEALRAQLGSMSAQIAAAQQRAALSEQTVEAAGQRILAHVEESFAAAAQRLGGLQQRIDGLEQGAESARHQSAQFQEVVGSELRILEQAVKAQSASRPQLPSARHWPIALQNWPAPQPPLQRVPMPVTGTAGAAGSGELPPAPASRPPTSPRRRPAGW